MSTTNNNTGDELLTDFIDEASQLLDRLNEDLLTLDEYVGAAGDACQRCDDALMNNMFRSAHSIKGLSAMLGLTNINRLTHRIENIFDSARKEELALNRQVVQVVFESIDHLSAMVTLLRSEGHDEHDASQVIANIQEILQTAGCERQATSQADAEKALQATLAAHEPSAPKEQIMSPAPLLTPVDHFAGIRDEQEVPTRYLSIFIDESEMSLDALSEILVSRPTGATKAVLEELLLTSHRIKGSAASIGLHRPAKLAHFMEDILQEFRETEQSLSPELTDALLHCVDSLRLYVNGLKTGAPNSENFNQLANELLSAHAGIAQAFASAVAIQTACIPAVPTPLTHVIDELRSLAQLHAQRLPLLVGRVRFVPGLALAGLKARLIYEKLCHAGELLETTPPMEGCDDLETLEELTFALATEATVGAIKAKAFVAGVQEVIVHEGATLLGEPAAPQKSAAASGIQQPIDSVKPGVGTNKSLDSETVDACGSKSRPPSDASNKPNETLRVDIERLDQLMNLAGQLVINKARFAQIGEGLKETMVSKQTPQLVANAANLSRKLLIEAERVNNAGAAMAELETVRSHARRLHADLEVLQRELAKLSQQRSRVNELYEAVHQLDRVSDGIQKSVMDTRMVPIGPLFGRFKRVVRDITRLNSKDINLIIRGEKTELDKRMIDELGDPLIHMVRNAADHGIESPEARVACGKPAQGTLTLDAFHRGNSIIIQVMDDGKGLDRDRILAKAIEKKLITAADAEKMTPQQAYQLIWEPGFSTAEKITEISGRGMGMDIVRSKIEEISGTVEVDSQPGQGTTFTIRLPLTLAIVPSLMAKIDGDVFALPVESIVEIVSVPADSLKTVHGRQTAVIRGRVVSVVELSELFDWSVPASKQRDARDDERTFVVLGQQGEELGLRVDTLLGEEDVVIKSMAENYRNVPGIAGASILGDGRVSLILDVAALISMSARSANACRQELATA